MTNLVVIRHVEGTLWLRRYVGRIRAETAKLVIAEFDLDGPLRAHQIKTGVENFRKLGARACEEEKQ
mgnify:CR=1 FL=1